MVCKMGCNLRERAAGRARPPGLQRLDPRQGPHPAGTATHPRLQTPLGHSAMTVHPCCPAHLPQSPRWAPEPLGTGTLVLLQGAGPQPPPMARPDCPICPGSSAYGPSTNPVMGENHSPLHWRWVRVQTSTFTFHKRAPAQAQHTWPQCSGTGEQGCWGLPQAPPFQAGGVCVTLSTVSTELVFSPQLDPQAPV